MAAFLGGRIQFTEMADVVEGSVARAGSAEVTCLEDVLDADREARAVAKDAVERLARR